MKQWTAFRQTKDDYTRQVRGNESPPSVCLLNYLKICKFNKAKQIQSETGYKGKQIRGSIILRNHRFCFVSDSERKHLKVAGNFALTHFLTFSFLFLYIWEQGLLCPIFALTEFPPSLSPTGLDMLSHKISNPGIKPFPVGSKRSRPPIAPYRDAFSELVSQDPVSPRWNFNFIYWDFDGNLPSGSDFSSRPP